MRRTSSLKNLKKRGGKSKSQIVKRGKHLYLINKDQPKFKAKQ